MGDSKAHNGKSNGVACAVTCITQSLNDNAHFHYLFNSLFQHMVDDKLDEDQVYVTCLDSGRDVQWLDRKKKLAKALITM